MQISAAVDFPLGRRGGPPASLGHDVKVSVCLAATRATTVGATARSIARQTHPDWELVVVAQGPHAARIRRTVEQEMPDATLLQFLPQAGWGLSRARNAAMRAAHGEVLAMIDDDCEAAPDWLAVLADCFEKTPRVGLVAGAVLAPPPSRGWPRNCPSCLPAEVLHDPAVNGSQRPHGWTWIGANFALRRSAADLIGPFDEFLGAGAPFPVAEEIDFMLRAEALNVPMLTTPRAVVQHTSGWRYGIPAVWRLQRNYARGNGGMAGKLTLLGDPRGRAALDEMYRQARGEWLRKRRPVALPAGVRRLYHFAAGYRTLVRDYRVGGDGLLAPRAPAGAGVD